MSPVFTSGIVKFPSKSVCVPLVDPLTNTLTPGNGSPDASSFTTPFTVCCANIEKEENKRIPIKNNLNFFMYKLLDNNCKFDLVTINLHSTLLIYTCMPL